MKIVIDRVKLAKLWYDELDKHIMDDKFEKLPPITDMIADILEQKPDLIKVIEDEGIYWCNSHQREASAIDRNGKHCCNPSLGGILAICEVKLIPAEIEPKNKNGHVD